MFAIIISEKGGGDRKETFDKSEINVGRVQGNDLMLPKGNVSKHHARLLFRDGRFIVTDLKSTNGTYVNGRKIAQATIVREGDKIYIGDFVLRLDGGAAAEASGDALEPVPEGMPERGVSSAGVVPNGGSHAAVAAPPPLPQAVQPQGHPAQSVPASGRGDPQIVSHDPPERGTGDGLPHVPAAPRMPQGMHAVAGATQTVPPRAGGLPGGTMPVGQPGVFPTSHPRSKASQIPDPDALAPVHPPTQLRTAPRESAEQAAHRLALVTLVDRVSEVIDLTPLKVSPLVDEPFSRLIHRTVREQAKLMREDGEAPEATDLELLIRDALHELVDLGPVGPLLDDDEVTEIHCVRHDHVLAVRGGSLQYAGASFTSEDSLARAIARLAAGAGEAWRPGELVVERRLPRGAQMIAIAPPASATYVLVIRKGRRVDMSLEDFVRAGALSRAMATFLESCLVARANILVCGPTSSETVALLAALASTGPAGDRVAVVQDLDEIAVAAAHVILFNPSDSGQRGEESVRAAARVRPDRLIIAALAGHMGAAALEAIADGADGVIAAIHAPSLRQALPKLVAQVLLARPSFDIELARECIGESFDIAIELGRLPDGRPRVIRLAELGGTDDKGIVARDIFTFVTEGAGAAEGSFTVSGVVPRVVSEFAARGVKVDPNIFKRVGRS